MVYSRRALCLTEAHREVSRHDMKNSGTNSGARILFFSQGLAAESALTRIVKEAGGLFWICSDPDSVEFIAPRIDGACCLVDLDLNDNSNFELAGRIRPAASSMPLVFMVSPASINETRRAFQLGADDVIERPFTLKAVKSVREIVNVYYKQAEKMAKEPGDFTNLCRLGGLTGRQSIIAELVVRGRSTKEIAQELGISPRTVDAHRAMVMQKVGARNSADLVRIALANTG